MREYYQIENQNRYEIDSKKILTIEIKLLKTILLPLNYCLLNKKN